MRAFWIKRVLPFFFTSLPLLFAACVLAAIPPAALRDYLERIRTSPLDWVILGSGSLFFLVQLRISVQALTWQQDDFHIASDRWLSQLAQTAEWFPLLGLIGTVAAILQTFSSISSSAVTPQEIIRKYAPAITATGGGLLMALINILPSWTVSIGRELIRNIIMSSDPPTMMHYQISNSHPINPHPIRQD